MAEISEHEAAMRIAIRTEGNYVNAYFCQRTSMDGALLLVSALRGPMERNAELFADFKAMAQTMLSAAFRDALGREPTRWETVAAPEHERAGNA